MTARAKQRPAAIRMVIPFVFRHWLAQPVRATTVAGGLLGATVAAVVKSFGSEACEDERFERQATEFASISAGE